MQTEQHKTEILKRLQPCSLQPVGYTYNNKPGQAQGTQAKFISWVAFNFLSVGVLAFKAMPFACSRRKYTVASGQHKGTISSCCPILRWGWCLGTNEWTIKIYLIQKTWHVGGHRHMKVVGTFFRVIHHFTKQWAPKTLKNIILVFQGKSDGGDCWVQKLWQLHRYKCH